MVRSTPKPKPRGVSVVPRLLRNKATRLRTTNAPRLFSFSHKVPLARDTMPHGVHMVNSPTDRRRTSTGSNPSAHGINMPSGGPR